MFDASSFKKNDAVGLSRDIKLALKMLKTTAADDTFILFLFDFVFVLVFFEKIMLDISCESSA